MKQRRYKPNEEVAKLYLEYTGVDGHGEVVGCIYMTKEVEGLISEKVKEQGKYPNFKGMVEGITHKYDNVLKYAEVPIHSIICKEDENISSGKEDVLCICNIMDKILQELGLRGREDITNAIITLEYDIETMRQKYRSRTVKIVLQEDVEIQGVLLKKGTEVYGQTDEGKKFCECLI